MKEWVLHKVLDGSGKKQVSEQNSLLEEKFYETQMLHLHLFPIVNSL